MDRNSRMNHTNKISKSGKSYRISTLFLGKNVNLNVGQVLDMTDDITILDNTVLAGMETHIWTHSFYVSKSSGDVARIDKSVNIGRNCYIGSRCTILPGIRITDGVTVGAQVCVSKDLEQSGLYVSQPFRFLSFDSDEKISSLGTPIHENIYRIER